MAINMSILPDQKLVLNAWAVLAGMAPGSNAYNDHQAYIAANGSAGFIGALNSVFAGYSDAQLGAAMLTNLHLTTVFTQADAEAYMAMHATDRVGAMVALADALYSYVGTDATVLAAQSAYQNDVNAAFAYSSSAANPNPENIYDLATDGTLFVLTAGTAAGADVMRLTGDQDARIDFTANDNQVKGLDLDGDGAIESNGRENNNPTAQDDGMDFEIVDAYARNPLNHYDRTNNFLGDIYFDGTGFAGDGVSTNGNIFLGGLGADQAAGGIGNDFMAGGGVAEQNSGQDFLFGGRNADFFHVTLSALDRVSGDTLDIDGGETSDDSWPNSDSVPDLSSSQDSDWILIEASDDDEPVLIDLGSATEGGTIRTEFMQDDQGNIDAGDANDAIDIIGIENVDASGNLYGFLDDLNVAMGEAGRVVNGENVGIGSSAQLRIIGSGNANILIGGFDNDRIDGEDGNDLLFGGRLDYNNNPNMQAIVNDGMDALYGDAGNDHIVFEADSGRADGGDGTDTLWLTEYSFGTRTAAQMTTDGTLRIDLRATDTDPLDQTAVGYGGYGGANVAGTQDQTNYAGAGRVTVVTMENVIATGLGAVDYLAAGSNNPELVFNNQQNIRGVAASLDLRGNENANTLYANAGDDVLEGREGADLLMGGDGDDDFYFQLGVSVGDGIDVIHRQTDANGDNLWDGTFSQDFGVNSTTTLGSSSLVVDFGATDLSSADVAVTSFSIRIAGVAFSVTDAAALSAANNAAEVAALVNTAFSAQDAAVSAVAVGNTVVITDTAGRDMSDTVAEGYLVGLVIANGSAQAAATYNAPGATVTQDRLIYKSYEDRSDNEGVDDDSVTGSTISLGVDSYAEDLVVSFGADGTRIAEDQSYQINFTNLTTEDKVTVTVNGVNYTLQVGVELDGTSVAGEDGVGGETQAQIQEAFLQRLVAYINSFMDDDTAAGEVFAAYTADVSGETDRITLTQVAYNGEETVFMTTPTVSIQQLSGGEAASATVTNASQHQVHLLDFDGRNGNLDAGNVLFVGQGDSRAVLATAANAGETVNGSEAILIDGGANTLEATVRTNAAAIFDNTATNASLATDFAAHGDDLLIGGNGNDVISGGTGDDRVLGSGGADTLDGGKNFYAVKVLGEAQSRVYILNDWESAAANIKSVVPELNGLTISSITLISQTENGTALASGRFDDTLLYQQADFTAGTTRFTVTLNDYTVDGGVVNLRHGGAGTVGVDSNGDGIIDSTSTFTNFENVRTVSGIGNAVAGDGQGNDTLVVSSLSTDTGGIAYDLTNRADVANTATGAGKVTYSANAHASATRPVEADFESLVMKVDGVENVVSGNGDDLVIIDETEAAKNNSFSAGLGDDRIEYQNDYDSDAAEPTVTIRVNAAADTDTVTMTAGRVGATVATDTLVGVEYVTLAGNTAEGTRENDVIDVTAMTTGAVVDYTNGEVRTAGSLAGTNVQVVIEGIAEIENVWADGNDTVIVADATAMGGANAREDNSDGTPDTDITFATFMDFDELTAANARIAFANQTTAQITDVQNLNQYTFDLSRTGGGNDTDTVDYSNAVDSIAVVVELDETEANQYVLVDGDAVAGDTFDSLTGADENRIDVLVDVERIVASQAESVLDLTASTAGLQVKFEALDVANRVAALDRDVYNVQISDLASSVPLTRSYVEYRDAGTNAAVTQATASWNRIEGSDNAERIILSSAHSTDDDTFNLRGGANEVKYNELTRSITTSLTVSDFVAATPLTTGRITATTTFQDGSGNPLPDSGTHVATSYTSDNGIAAGSLRIAASQDAEDTITFAGATEKLFVLGEVGTTDNQITVRIGEATANNSVILTGYEFLQDANSSDVYDMGLLANVTGNLTLTDTAGDHDAIKVGNDAVGFNGSGANTIDLDNLGATAGGFAFDFDVLDVTRVTNSNLVLNGGSNDGDPGTEDADDNDEVVLGALSQVVSIAAFEGMVMTQASVAGGTSFTFDAAANTLTQGSTTVSTSADVLSFGGLTQEGSLRDNRVADVTTGVTVTVTGATAATVRGGDGNDAITGSAGNDVLHGNGGNDTLDGGIATEVRQFNLQGIEAAADDLTITFDNGTTAGATTIVIDDGADFAQGAGNDAIGTAIATKLMANLAATNTAFSDNGATPGAAIVNVSYSTDTDLLTFTFAAGANVSDAISLAVAGTAGTFAISAETTVTNGGDGGENTFVFENTAAANGVDAIANFKNADAGNEDVLDFTAFLGGASVNDAAGAVNGGTGDMTLAAETVGVFFNKGTLTAANIVTAGTAANGEVIMANNAKAVILATADADGGIDATNEGYNIYFVEDTDTGAGQTWVVTLVGTVTGAAELAAGAFFTGGNDSFA